jgi:phosphoesterase RecJ-like protein
MTQAVEWEKATQAIRKAQTVLVVTHVSPDGDAIGSALGLANALKQMGKTVTVADDDVVPDYLRFLPGADAFVQTLDSGSWDVMISTDISDEARGGFAGDYGRNNSGIVINLDHHITNIFFGDIHLVIPTAVSATEIVFDWWEFIGIDWTPEVAMPLLTGLVTDTLGFRTNNVSPRTLEVAQKLMGYGASLTEATSRTLESKSWQEVSLWKRVLPSAELHGEVISVVIRQEDFEAVGTDDFSTSGLVGFFNRVNEARIAIAFVEEASDEIRISMRSKPGYDVAKVAFDLGGGGHQQAAGATIIGTLQDAKALVLPMLQEVTKQGKQPIV